MIYCAKCGYSLNDDATFCPECGTKTEIPTATATSAVVPNTAPVQEPITSPIPAKPVVEIPQSEKQFCRNCGKEVAAGAFACMVCGLPPMKAYNFCPCCGSNCHQDAVICIKCGVKLESQESRPSSNSSTTKEVKKTFCRNCGKDVLQGAVACLNCGLPPGKSKNFCPSCGSETHNEAILCVKCGTALEAFAIAQTQQASSTSNQKPAPNQTSNVVIIGTQKSVGTAFILAFLFGPLGLLYASPVGGIIMFFVGIVLFFILPIVGFVLAWIISIIWAVVAAQNANQSALNQGANISKNLNQQQ